MSGGIEVRTVRPGDVEQVRELHHLHYWRDRCLLLNPSFYRWQFEEGPGSLAAGGDQSVVAVDAAGRLLSFMAVLPARFLSPAGPLDGMHLLSWLSVPEARGRGLGGQVLEWVTRRYPFVMGRSASPTALPVYRRFGCRYQPCRRWVALLDDRAAAPLLVRSDAAALARLRARVVPRAEVVPTTSREPPPGASDLAGEALGASHRFERTEEYLRWRYVAHPVLRYEFVSLGGPERLDALAVTRVEDIRGREGRALRVVELMARPGQEKRIAQALLARGRALGCAFADVFGVSERFVGGWIAAGGFDTAEEPELQVPHLLQPWDAATEPPGVFFIGRRGGDLELGPADDLSSIYISKGDGNLDWPSWVPDAAGESIAPRTRRAEVGR